MNCRPVRRTGDVAILPLLLGVISVISLVAVLLGRLSPPTIEQSRRSPTLPRYHGIGDFFLDDKPGMRPRLLDTESGQIARCPVPGTENLVLLSCSPGRDGAGRYHFVGRWANAKGNMTGDPFPMVGLMRFTLPAGGPTQYVPMDMPPVSRPCWYPDGSDRLLFACADGQLYSYSFSADREPDGADPQALRWRAGKPHGDGAVIVLGDPCWPALPGLDGRVLVTLQFAEDPSSAWEGGLWWLRLSPDGTQIVAAERAIVPDPRGPVPHRKEMRLPSVGLAPDGTPALAYLARDRDQATWELWLMSITPATDGRGPRVRTSTGRRLAEGCAAVAPVFSADGRRIYAWRGGNTELKYECLILSTYPAAAPGLSDRRDARATIVAQ